LKEKTIRGRMYWLLQRAYFIMHNYSLHINEQSNATYFIPRNNRVVLHYSACPDVFCFPPHAIMSLI